jgi:hypothetical protein
MNRSDSIGALVAALAKAQKAIVNPALDSVNPHFKNKYASLAAHLSAVRGPLADQGIALIQSIKTPANGGVSVTTMLAHCSGEWISSEVSMPLPERATAQQLGSCVTYLRRYAIATCCLIVGDEDTDGEEDRLARTKPSEPTKYSYSDRAERIATAKAVVAAASPSKPSSPPKASEGIAKKWPDTGTDIVTAEKVVDRGTGTNAVLCSHPSNGRQWVSVPDSMITKVRLDKPIELSWEWNKEGFFVATSVGEVPAKPKRDEAKAKPVYDMPITDDDLKF